MDVWTDENGVSTTPPAGTTPLVEISDFLLRKTEPLVSGVKTGFKILGSLKPVIKGVSITVEPLLRTRTRTMSLLLSPKCKSNLDSRGTRLFASASVTVATASRRLARGKEMIYSSS